MSDPAEKPDWRLYLDPAGPPPVPRSSMLVGCALLLVVGLTAAGVWREAAVSKARHDESLRDRLQLHAEQEAASAYRAENRAMIRELMARVESIERAIGKRQ